MDHGRAITPEEARTTHWQRGYRYEIIDGKICATPIPNLPHDRILRWLYRLLDRYTAWAIALTLTWVASTAE